MRICYLCADPGVPVFGRKGCSTHVRENCLSLSGLGHDVRLICTNAEGDNRDLGGVRVVPVEPVRSRKVGFDLRHYLSNLRAARMAERLFRDWRPDAIYERYALFSTAGGSLARRHNLPHMLEVNAFITRELKDRINCGPLASWFERRIIKQAAHVVVVSEPLQREIAALRGEEQAETGGTISRMPMAVNLAHFHPGDDGAEIRARHGWEDKFILGYVGTLTGWHGINLLYDLARLLRELGIEDFVIMLIGGDEKRLDQHRRRIAEAGLDDFIRFLGPMAYASVPQYIRAMDVALVPDTTYWSSPAKLFEYQGCGVPVLAPRYPAIEKAMTHEVEGMIFEPRNVREMAEMILKLYRDPESRRRMGWRGRLTAETFHSWESQARRVVEIFEEQERSLRNGR